MAAELRDEAAARAQPAPYAADHVVCAGHPMQRCVAEYRVELVFELQSLAVHHARVQPQRTRAGYLRLAGIDADNVASHCRQFRGKHPVAASQVQDALADVWRQQLEYWRTKVGNEACVLRVSIGVPGLRIG